MAERTLSVRMHGRPVADLIQDESGRLWLRYLTGAHLAISLCLPVQAEAHPPDLTEPFFGNLLPETEAIREAIGQRTGANPRNTFSLLSAIGQECAGALSLHPPTAPVAPADPVPLVARILTQEELSRHLRELPRQPLMVDVSGLRLSLAGAQEKAAVNLVDGQIAIPLEGTPSTHILKPAHPLYPHLVDNEYLCLSLAQDVGLSVPAVEIRQAEGKDFLLIERYDRSVDQARRVKRLHQEDFCQALGVAYARKYQSEGGPGLSESFHLMDRLTVPARERLDLLRRVIFNVLVGNCDAHAKNYSILYRPGGLTLAPVYDVICTRYYPDLQSRLAMNIGGENKPDALSIGCWRRFCERTGVGFPLFARTFIEVNATLQAAIKRRVPQSPAPAHQALLHFIAGNAADLVTRFEQQRALGR